MATVGSLQYSISAKTKTATTRATSTMMKAPTTNTTTLAKPRVNSAHYTVACKVPKLYIFDVSTTAKHTHENHHQHQRHHLKNIKSFPSSHSPRPTNHPSTSMALRVGHPSQKLYVYARVHLCEPQWKWPRRSEVLGPLGLPNPFCTCAGPPALFSSTYWIPGSALGGLSETRTSPHSSPPALVAGCRRNCVLVNLREDGLQLLLTPHSCCWEQLCCLQWRLGDCLQKAGQVSWDHPSFWAHALEVPTGLSSSASALLPCANKLRIAPTKWQGKLQPFPRSTVACFPPKHILTTRTCHMNATKGGYDKNNIICRCILSLQF